MAGVQKAAAIPALEVTSLNSASVEKAPESLLYDGGTRRR